MVLKTTTMFFPFFDSAAECKAVVVIESIERAPFQHLSKISLYVT